MKRICKFFLLPLIAISIVDFAVSASKHKTSYALTYDYKHGVIYHYNKITQCHNENFLGWNLPENIFTSLSMNVVYTTDAGVFQIEYALDSTISVNSNNKSVSHSKIDLKSACLSRNYTRRGVLINQSNVPMNEKEYLKHSDCSDIELLFELPSDSIEIGKSWNTFKSETGNFLNRNWKRKNTLIGIEEKNGHRCFRIDFSGDVRNFSISGDLQQVESGSNNGTLWLDIEKHIIVAIETEVQMTDININHPGGAGLIKSKKFIIMPSHTTVFNLIE